MGDSVGAYYYDRHLQGVTKFARSASKDRLALLTRFHIRQLTELAVNRFKWEGLPKEIDVRFLEITLFYNALAVFFRDPLYDKFFALRGTSAGYINMYDNPTRFRVVGNGNYVGRTLKASECVPIWGNYLRAPELDIVMIYASRLAEIDLTIEINSRQARRTKILQMDENQRLSLVNITKQIDEGNPVIQVTNSFDPSMIQALDLGVNPDSILNMSLLRARIKGEAVGALGINTANQDKKERLVESEVDANNDEIASIRNYNLNARKNAAEQINAMFGTAITCDYRNDDKLMTAEPDDDEAGTE